MPTLTFDSDTHYSWVNDDVIKGGKLRFADGALEVPTGPGLGVELDHEAVDRLHALYNSAGVRDRDDTDEYPQVPSRLRPAGSQMVSRQGQPESANRTRAPFVAAHACADRTASPVSSGLVR